MVFIISKLKFSILVHKDLLVILSISTAFFICAMLFGPSFVISTLGSSLVVVTFCLESFCSIFSFQQHNGREGVINQKKTLLFDKYKMYVLRFVQYVHCCRLQVVYSPVTLPPPQIFGRQGAQSGGHITNKLSLPLLRSIPQDPGKTGPT